MATLNALGTVVKVRGQKAEYTIIGYYPVDGQGQVHTYLGVNAALGLSLAAGVLPFDQEEIEETVFLGFSEEKSEKFRIRLGALSLEDREG